MMGHPSRVSIKTWRDNKLPDGERGKVNHPKRVWTAYLAATEPRAEKDAKRAERERRQATKSDPMLDKVGEAEAETHAARRQLEGVRELLAYIRDHVDLPEDIVVKIDAEKSSPSTQRNFLNTVRPMFDWALSEGRIPDSDAWRKRAAARFRPRDPDGS